MDRMTGQLPSVLFDYAMTVLEDLRLAKSVAEAFDVACAAVRKFAPSSCLNLWMHDEKRERLCLAHATIPDGSLGEHVRHSGYVCSSHELNLLLDPDRADCAWLPSDVMVREKPLVCKRAAGIAYLRLATSDGLPLLFTACVPQGMEGDYSSLPPYFRLLGQGLLHAIERIRARNELRLLSEISGLAVGEKTPAEFFEEVAHRVAAAFGALGCSIFVYNEFRDVLTLGGTTGLYKISADDSQAASTLKFSAAQLADLQYARREGLTGWIFEHRRVVRLYDAFDANEWSDIDSISPVQPLFKSAESPPRLSPRTFLGAPIIDKGRLLGVVRLHGKPAGSCSEGGGKVEEAGEGRYFLPSDERRLSAVCAALGRAMAQWTEHFEVRESLHQRDLLSQVQKLLDNSQDLRSSLTTIAEQAKQLLKGCAASVLLLSDEQDGVLSVEAEACDRPTVAGKVHVPLHRGLCGTCATSLKTVVESDTKRPESLFYGLDDVHPGALKDVRSEACAPIRVGQRLLGVLNVDSDRATWFTENDPKLLILERLASYAALVICRERDTAAATGSWSAKAMAHQFKDEFEAFLWKLDDCAASPTLSGSDRRAIDDVKKFSKERAKYWDTMSADNAFDKTKPEPHYVNDLIANAGYLFEGLRTGNAVDFDFDLCCGLGESDATSHRVLLDLLQFHLIVSNLIENAIESMNGRGCIAVKTQLAGNEAKLVIVDRGKGVPSVLKEQLFKAHVSTKGRRGKGCLLVGRMVRSHGGTIEISDTAGGGTTITVSFPLMENGVAQ